MVFFYHAHKVRQPGTVTRIISGCSSKDQKEQETFFQQFIQPMRPDFYIHFTPDFAKVKKAHGGPYKYMNKRTSPHPLMLRSDGSAFAITNDMTTMFLICCLVYLVELFLKL
jgi:hypothetical protein